MPDEHVMPLPLSLLLPSGYGHSSCLLLLHISSSCMLLLFRMISMRRMEIICLHSSHLLSTRKSLLKLLPPRYPVYLPQNDSPTYMSMYACVFECIMRQRTWNAVELIIHWELIERVHSNRCALISRMCKCISIATASSGSMMWRIVEHPFIRVHSIVAGRAWSTSITFAVPSIHANIPTRDVESLASTCYFYFNEFESITHALSAGRSSLLCREFVEHVCNMLIVAMNRTNQWCIFGMVTEWRKQKFLFISIVSKRRFCRNKKW